MPLLDVKIPSMGESITSGVLAKWHVQDGDLVKRDQPLFELETDKITSEGTAEAAGRVTLKVAAGSEVKIGQLVATIEVAAAGDRRPETGGRPPAAAVNTEPKTQKPEPKASTAPASPAVRRLAAETGIDPAVVAGRGKGSRVTKADMLSAAEAAKTLETGDRKPEAGGQKAAGAGLEPRTPNPEPVAAPDQPAGAARHTRRKLSPLRQRIAQRLVQAQHEAAMLTTFNEVDMSAVRELRVKYQEEFTRRYGVKLGFMSFFLKAVVRALQEVPAINARIEGDTIVENHYYDIGVAISTDRGLVVPVLRDCEQIGFGEVERQLADAARRAREGKITLADLEGGVFTITNGGIFGSLLSTPILNTPQCGILGMHAIQDRPVAVNGQVVIRPMMYLAFSYDHRIVDGREAVTFLVRVKQVLEDPARLLLSV
ncbi:MAG: 2-oxoglutarate dehydrogenase complex dihydrolipoyllysine-residue succinyltransferase [Opitutaceae bacterium]|nr:2-oxoglutarate dehydrogenase complex dihydrolipoyllysine-residue succinyltransferase [Opitutaceae bacterium]